ncbi:MAG TPA: tRNA preQ1(34) S-adenosylmethionine ribosyltransferase-isomerase QueA [Gammaproteobacteria bacterium]|nr:tRNA preQ1(34) S-adenosylmethionine ribosyltransferase-isomerase QueA [Gammaproteobacteria bacterium]
MRRDEFSYDLPEELIAQYPADKRGSSRLLCLHVPGGELEDRMFRELPELLRTGDLLVFNDTRVIPARLYGHKETGGKVEILVERLQGKRRAVVQLRASKTPAQGSIIRIENNASLKVIDREDDMFMVEFAGDEDPLKLLERAGHMPLPPYIHRSDETIDRERYQTVYATTPGAVAAPTAGLHFTPEILSELESSGIESAFVTLHVGAGTFQPVRAEHIEDHRMHSEFASVPEIVCEKVNQARERGGRVIAVGTTSVRCLEVATRDGSLLPFKGETDLFIYPGYSFRVVDALITNFHLPESSLLMLISAFAGRDQIMNAYKHAIRERYRFYSYGDAMFISQ